MQGIEVEEGYKISYVSNSKRSVWLQNYNHALSGAFIETKNKQNSFLGRREAIYFFCTIPCQFHCQNNSKVQQTLAASCEPGFRQEKSFVSLQHFQKR